MRLVLPARSHRASGLPSSAPSRFIRTAPAFLRSRACFPAPRARSTTSSFAGHATCFSTPHRFFQSSSAAPQASQPSPSTSKEHAELVHKLEGHSTSSSSATPPLHPPPTTQEQPASAVLDPESPPRRAMLYVPGSSEKMIKRALGLQADSLIFDLEDSVAMHRKNVARETVMYALGASPRPGPELLVRINPPSGDASLAQDDLDVILPSTQLQGIVIPKVESAKDIRMVIERAESLRPNLDIHAALSLVLSIESAASLLHMHSILQEVHSWNKDNVAYVSALLFASEDYCASTGIIRTRSRRELLFPRAHMVTTAKAHRLSAIDMVCVDYRDEPYLIEECRDGRELGYDGKQAIHPGQVEVIHRTFSPSEADILWAARIRHAYKESVTQNRGAVGLQQGESMVMIDAPMLKQAEATLAKAHAAGLPIPDGAPEKE